MAVLHSLRLASLLDAELSLPAVFGFSSYDLEVNRMLRLSWRQRFYPVLTLLPFIALTLVLLWLINTGLTALTPVLIEAEFLQAVTPAATLALLFNRFWDILLRASMLPWSDVRVFEGVLQKRIDMEQDSDVQIVRYFCVIGGATLSLTPAQFNALNADVMYRVYVAHPVHSIMSIEVLAQA